MTIRRMEHVGIVVDDLAAAIAFFAELGLVLQGEAPADRGATGTWRQGCLIATRMDGSLDR